MTAATAAEIAREFPAGAVAAKVEVFDWLSGRNDRRLRVNPAGYLVESIRKDYAPPTGFESRPEAARRQESQRDAERKAEDLLRLKADEKARARADLDAIDDYWKLLTPGQQARLDADALASADRDAWESCKNMPALAAMFRRNIRRDRIRNLLAGRGSKVTR